MNNKYIYLGDNKIVPLDDHAIFIMGDDWIRGRYEQWLGEEYIKTLPTIKVNGSHSWEDFQPLEKDIDFVIAESSLKEGRIIEAIPLSKPNTDVKQDQKQHIKDIMEADGKDGLYDVANPAKYSKEDMIGFPKWLYDNRWFNYDYQKQKWCYTFEHGTALSEKAYEKNYMKTTEQLLNLYTQSPEFKNNQL